MMRCITMCMVKIMCRFTVLFLPAILMGAGEYHLPDKLFSSEYLSLEGKAIFHQSRVCRVGA